MRYFQKFMLAAALPAVCAAMPLAAQAAGPITAGSITNSPPMISYASDGTTLQGVIVDLAAAMSKQMGRQIVFKAMPFSGLLPAMQAKRIDISFTLMNDTPKREELVDFVDFFNLGTMLLIKKGNPQHVQSLETMCGMTVSTVQGSTQVTLVNEVNAKCSAAGKPAIKNMQYAQPSDARLQVQTGRVAAFLGNSPVMVYLAKTADNGKLFDVVAGHVYQPVPLGISVAKDNTALRDQLQKALNALIADGSYLKILQKYGVADGALKSAAINGGKNLKL
ncbi:ABC transporter substrate-binding protein [Candidimonas nitroreducens]|uniref:ABC transporter substrate-binding protein n=1 Tax=Candidimonas nitroreducens TaxID=683354 RepID=A0A225MA20_9BURK|nr:ABC transporter substrate-binding protein [Candidimonas nitroreducens]OWT58157.1 ABC transporter substrate-binding protein [Candidimonas nitroreducens]